MTATIAPPSTHIYTVIWPIRNPNLPLANLHAEAVEQLRLTAATHSWEYVTGPNLPVLKITHRPPTLTATVRVRVRPDIEAAA